MKLFVPFPVRLLVIEPAIVPAKPVIELKVTLLLVGFPNCVSGDSLYAYVGPPPL